ncbi:MAG: T9SS type A sorting domain-containing protein [Bacteroidales bacterium]|nr:T9SS type A sorting domain-containing protein [Bacteroidales bacterium]
MFGNTDTFNTYGVEYYKAGVFELVSNETTALKAKADPVSVYNSAYDWRAKHGANNPTSPYYDGDPVGSGWITSIKNQGGCGSCWAFAATGTAEAIANLYFNQHLNMDLAEQDALSCSGAGTCAGGWPGLTLDYFAGTGVVNESCFPYAGSDLACSQKCASPAELVKIGGQIAFPEQGSKTEDELKRMLIKYGPISGGVYPWSHALVMVGYKVLKAGDYLYHKTYDNSVFMTLQPGDPLIGRTAWIFKNSWGESFGEDGYINLVTDISNIGWTHAALLPVTSQVHQQTSIKCLDLDGDGYYNWGIGPKPAHCPPCPDLPDGDDSNPALGPVDEFGFYETQGQANAQFANAAFNINGVLDEPAWQITNTLTKNIIGQTNNTCAFGAAWDSNYLYIGIVVNDNSLTNDSPYDWEDDAVEIYIDADMNRGTVYDALDRQFVKGYESSACWEQHSHMANVLHAWSATSTGYRVEMAIAWSNLGISPNDVHAIGFDVAVDDDDDGGNRESQAMWNGTNDNWHNTSAFGTLNLAQPQPDVLQPPYSLVRTHTTQTTGHFSWKHDQPEKVQQFDVFVNNNAYGGTTANFIDILNLSANTQYTVEVRAAGTDGTHSGKVAQTFTTSQTDAVAEACKLKPGETITVNGVVDEPWWKYTESLQKVVVGPSANNTCIVAMLWDDNYLYLAARVWDFEQWVGNSESPWPWEDDALEVFIDGLNEKSTTYDANDRQFVKGYNTTGLFEQFNNVQGVLCSWATAHGSYTFEMAVPWTNIGITPAEDAAIGIDFAIDDDDNGGTRESQTVWAGAIDNWANPSNFGSVILRGSIVPADETMPIADEGASIVLSAAQHAAASFSFYPNPASSTVNLNLKNNFAGWVNVSFYDMYGKLCDSRQLNKSQPNFTHQIDISALKTGLYVVKLTMGNQGVMQKLMVR